MARKLSKADKLILLAAAIYILTKDNKNQHFVMNADGTPGQIWKI